MPEITIRAATPADLAAITAIYQDAVLHGTATFELDPPDLAEMTRRFETLQASAMPYLVAERLGRIAGYAYAGPYRPRAAYRFTVENSIYLAPEQQRAGIGAALLQALIEACTQRGVRQVIAVIGDSANAGSIALHRKLGFTMVGTHKAVGFKFGRWLDTVDMQLAINGGGTTLPG